MACLVTLCSQTVKLLTLAFNCLIHLQQRFICLHIKSLQSCLTLWDPMDCSPPGSSVHRIIQARILEWLPCPPPGGLPDPASEPTSL